MKAGLVITMSHALIFNNKRYSFRQSVYMCYIRGKVKKYSMAIS